MAISDFFPIPLVRTILMISDRNRLRDSHIPTDKAIFNTLAFLFAGGAAFDYFHMATHLTDLDIVPFVALIFIGAPATGDITELVFVAIHTGRIACGITGRKKEEQSSTNKNEQK